MASLKSGDLRKGRCGPAWPIPLPLAGQLPPTMHTRVHARTYTPHHALMHIHTRTHTRIHTHIHIRTHRAIVIVAIVGQSVGLVHMLWRQLTADIFFIDWERPRKVLSRDGACRDAFLFFIDYAFLFFIDYACLFFIDYAFLFFIDWERPRKVLSRDGECGDAGAPACAGEMLVRGFRTAAHCSALCWWPSLWASIRRTVEWNMWWCSVCVCVCVRVRVRVCVCVCVCV